MKLVYQIRAVICPLILIYTLLLSSQGLLAQITPSSHIEQLLSEADSLRRLRQVDPALERVGEAMTAMRDEDTNSELLAKAYLTKGRILLRTEACYRADVPLREALARYLQLDDPNNTYRAYRNLAELQLLLENYSESIQLYYEASRFAAKEWGERSYQVGLLHMFMSTCYKYLGDFGTADQYIQSAISLLSESLSQTDYRLAEAFFRAGGLYFGSDQFQQAVDAYKRSLQIIQTDSSRRMNWIQDLHNNLGAAYWELGKKEEALLHYRAAMKTELERNPESIAVWEGELEAGNSSQEEAGMKYFLSTLERRKRTYGRHHPGTAGCYLYIGQAHEKRGETQKALSSYQQAIASMLGQSEDMDVYAHPQDFPSTNREELLLDALIGKAMAFERLCQETTQDTFREAAFAACQSTSRFIQQIRRGQKHETSHMIWNQKVAPFFAFAIDIAWELYSKNPDSKYLNQAFEWIEQGRSFGLLQTIRKDQALSFARIPSTVLKKERELKNKLTEYGSFILAEENKGEQGESAKLDALQQGKLTLEGEYQSFLQNLEQLYPSYFQLKYKVEVSQISDLQSVLQQAQTPEGWLVYAEGSHHMYSMLITADSVIWQRTDSLKFLSKVADQLRVLLSGFHKTGSQSDSVYKSYLQTAHQLYQSLIAPLQNWIPERTIISPTGYISYLPFEAFLTKNHASDRRNYADLSYLLHQYTFSYAYSATFFLELSQKPQGYRWFFQTPYLGFAPSYGETSLASTRDQAGLHFTKEEIRQSAAEMKGRYYLDEEATKDRFIKQASHANVLHLAMHAQLNDSSPEYSHLTFYQEKTKDPNLYIFELFGLELACNLAVLSACNTGTGKWIHGEGLMSLARGFSYAGCPSLVVSLWQVDDEATSSIMTTFFQELAADQHMDQAIRQAQLTYLAQGDPLTAHPYFWAGWKLLGKSELRQPTPILQYIFALGVGIVFLLIFILSYRYKRSSKSRAFSD